MLQPRAVQGTPELALRPSGPGVLEGVPSEGRTCGDLGCFQGLLCRDELGGGGACSCAWLDTRSVLIRT